MIVKISRYDFCLFYVNLVPFWFMNKMIEFLNFCTILSHNLFFSYDSFISC